MPLIKMKNRAKRIQIYLPDGDINSIQIAKIKNGTIKAILIPRTKYKEPFLTKKIKEQSGFYFLIEQKKPNKNSEIYIGEGNFLERLIQHTKNKKSWNYMLVIVSNTDEPISKTDGLFLEYYAYTMLKNMNQYILKQREPKKTNINEDDEEDLKERFEDIKLLTSILGCSIFNLFEENQVLKQRIEKDTQENLLFCKRKNAFATGVLKQGNKLLVFKGSTAVENEVKSIGKSEKKRRQELIDAKVLKKQGEVYQFSKDYLFSSLSYASTVITGSSSNGWDDWKDKNKKTLKEINK